jgi:hypothetical protein
VNAVIVPHFSSKWPTIPFKALNKSVYN